MTEIELHLALTGFTEAEVSDLEENCDGELRTWRIYRDLSRCASFMSMTICQRMTFDMM